MLKDNIVQNRNSKISAGAKRSRADYMRSWRSNNKDKQKAYINKHWEKKAFINMLEMYADVTEVTKNE